jgi:hypothetical protein
LSNTVRSPIRLKFWKMNPISRLRVRARSRIVQIGDRLAVQPVLAGRRRVEQPEDRQERRLATTRRSGDRHVLAPSDLEMDAAKCVGLHFVGVENFFDAVEGLIRF